MTASSFNDSQLPTRLDNKALLNRASNTVVGIWELDDTSSNVPDKTESFLYTQGIESVRGSDDRERVAANDYAPGGKFRSIVKLFIHFGGQKESDPWMLGTGWLIQPDLLVTAGHCAYDWNNKLGYAKKVKAYIGYEGKESTGDANVQFRLGEVIAAPGEWLSGPSKTYDVSFVKLNKAFTGINPFSFSDTPSAGNQEIGVVGYPGDLSAGKSGSEKGGYMYEHFLRTEWDLAEHNNMLSYHIDTFGGNSGSPVLLGKSKGVAIGVHAYGGNPNQASVIGVLGNVFSDYLRALATSKTAAAVSPAPKNVRGFKVISVAPLTAADTNGTSTKFGKEEPAGEEEGIFDIIRSAIQFAAPVVGTLGPIIGGPFGAIAGIAIGAAAKLTESGFEGTESVSSNEVSLDGLAERAILQEAALVAVLGMSQDIMNQEGAFEDMANFLKNISPSVRNALPQVVQHLTPIALDLSLGALKLSGTESEFEDGHIIKLTNTANLKTESSFQDTQTEAFVQRLFESADQADTEGFFDDFRDILNTGLKIGKGIIGVVAKTGLPVISQVLGPNSKAVPYINIAGKVLSGLTESDFENVPKGNPLQGAAERAMMGEAALNVVMKLPQHVLMEEGIFDVMKSVVQKIGPLVTRYAPKVINAMAPFASEIVKQASYKDTTSTNRSLAPRPAITKKKSFRDLQQTDGSNFMKGFKDFHSK